MPKCIYSEKDLNDDVPANDSTRSIEHIIPWAIGGSNGLTTNDVSRKASNDLGSEVDAAFANTLPLAIMRHKLQLPGHSGSIPPIVWNGQSADGHRGKMIISADGTVDVQLDYGVDRPNGSLGPITVKGPRERIEPILRGMLGGMKKRGEVAISSEGLLLDSLDAFWAASEQKLIDKLNFNVEFFDQDAWTRGIVKIVLSACHKLLGPEWTFGADAGRLRQIVNNARSGWPASGSVRGYIAGEWDRNFRSCLGKDAKVRDGFLHTVAVLPAGRDGQAIALVSLFGGNNVPEAVVFIGKLPEPMIKLLNSDQCLTAIMGYRIDPRTRHVDEISFGYIDEKTKRSSPSKKKVLSVYHKLERK